MVCRVLYTQIWISGVGIRKKGLAEDGRWIEEIGEKMSEKMSEKIVEKTREKMKGKMEEKMEEERCKG